MQSISNNFVKQLAILKDLAKPQNFISNNFVKQLAIYWNLPFS